MRTTFPLTRSTALPLLVVALLASACSNNSGTNDDGMDMDTTASTMDQRTGTYTNGSGTASDRTTSGFDADGKPVAHRTMTPAEERAAAATDMRGLRATLVADLEEVRARLNVGTAAAPAKELDQKLAGELAQGLERVDRALAAMDAGTDVTWSTLREAQLKEVSEVRAWMATYKGTGSTVNR